MNQGIANHQANAAPRLHVWLGHNARWLLWVYLAALLCGTHWPRTIEPPPIPGPLDPVLQYDKFVHYIGFCGLMILLVMSGLGAKKRSWSARCGISLIIASVFACLNEYTQQWIAGRSMDWTDLFANLLGIGSAYLLAMLPRHREKIKPPRGLKLAIAALFPATLALLLMPEVIDWIRKIRTQLPEGWRGSQQPGDHLFHAIIAMVFSVLLIVAWPMTSNRPRRAAVLTLATLLLSAVLIEIAQHFTGRSVEAADARAHIIGVSVALIWWGIALTRSLRHREYDQAHLKRERDD